MDNNNDSIILANSKASLNELMEKTGLTRDTIRKKRIKLGLPHLRVRRAYQRVSKEIAGDIEYDKLRAENKNVTAKYKEALHKISLVERERNLAAGISIKPYSIRKKSIELGNAVAFMVASDWHYAERIDPEVVNGMNDFNPKIASKRAEAFFRNGLKLIEICKRDVRIKTAIIPLLGDLINNTIHEDSVESNTLSQTEEVDTVENVVISGIEYILANSDLSITMPCHSGNHARCHDSETELLTIDGWKKYDQIKMGDVVATYNMESEKTEWQHLQDVYINSYNGPMIKVKTTTADFLVTPHHRMVVRSHKGKDQFIQMQEFVNKGTMGSYNWPKCSGGNGIDYQEVSDDELRLMGWVMTDGYVHKGNKNNPSPTIHISQSKERGKKILTEILIRAGIKHYVRTRLRKPPIIKGVQAKSVLPESTYSMLVESSNRFLSCLVAKREIPTWMYKLSKRQFNVFLEGLLSGDGNVHRGRGKNTEIRVIYGDLDVISSIQTLAVVNGIAARVCVTNRGDGVLSLPISKRGWINNLGSSVKTVQYNGIIWCGTVANGTLITRRNGIPLVSGNTVKERRVSTEAGNSLEWLMYTSIAKYFKHNPRVMVMVNKGYLSYLEVYDRTIRFSHGHNVRYAGGVGGIYIPLNKAINQYNKIRHVYLDVLGHFHTLRDGGNFIENGCFPAGSVVTCKDCYKPIEQVNTGDLVLSHDGTWNKVTNKTSRTSDEGLVHLKIKNIGEPLSCTPNHEIWAIKGETSKYGIGEKWNSLKGKGDKPQWIPADFISQWDYVSIPIAKNDEEGHRPISSELATILVDGMLFSRVSARYRDREVVTVYDLEVEGPHTYTVNHCGVHNSLCGYNAYALSIKADYEEPRQAFFLIDKKRGKTITAPILLNE